MSTYKIRKASIADAKAIAIVNINSWKETYKGIVSDDYLEKMDLEIRIPRWKDGLSKTDKHLWNFVALDEKNQVVGFISGGKARKNIDFSGELYAIYLLRAHQKKNIGFKLTKTLCEEFKKANLLNMYVGVLKDNDSKGFYTKYGAKFLFEENIEIGDKSYKEEFYGWRNLSSFLQE